MARMLRRIGPHLLLWRRKFPLGCWRGSPVSDSVGGWGALCSSSGHGHGWRGGLAGDPGGSWGCPHETSSTSWPGVLSVCFLSPELIRGRAGHDRLGKLRGRAGSLLGKRWNLALKTREE